MSRVFFWVRVGAVLLTVLVSIAVFDTYVRPSMLYQESARQGIAWLLEYPDDYKNPGVFWVLREVNKEVCHSDAFKQKIEERFESLPRTDVERAYFYFPTVPITEDMLQSTTLARYDAWLLEALSCQERSLTPSVQDTLLSFENSFGYDLTHTYIALSYIQRRGCEIEGVSLPETLSTIENKMAEEEAQKRVFSDISVERSALLLWGGRTDLVSDVWLERVKEAQDVSGGWGENGGAPNPHTTALALWTLVQTTDACPL